MNASPRVLATLLGASLLLTACGGGGDATPEATDSAAPEASASDGAPTRSAADLVIWSDELKSPAIKPIAEKFAADNGITVDVQTIPASDLQSAVVTANTAGNGPDVFTGAHDWIGNLVQNGAVTPLQVTPDALSGYADIAVKATTYQGNLYGLPYGFEAVALYRNTAIVPDEPATLDDAIDAGLKAVDSGKVDSALNLQQGDNGDAYHMEPLYTSMGGYLFGTTAEGDSDPTDLGVGKEGSIAAAKKIGELGEKGSNVLRRSISDQNSIALFASGKAAFLISGPWALKDIKDGGIDYAISPVPGFAGAEPAKPFSGVQAFYVASKGQNQALAQEFVGNAMNTPESMQAMYDGATIPPSMNSVADGLGTDDADVKVFVEAARNGDPMPAIPAMASVWEPLGKAYSAIIGGADPTKTMTDAGNTIAAAIK